MAISLSGKRSIVTGGSKGIGLAIAAALRGEGGDVLICGRDGDVVQHAVEKLEALPGTGKVAGCKADVSSAAEVDALFEEADGRLGGVDILVNNAGFGVFKPTAELTVEEWDQLIGTNLSGAFYCSKAALGRMKKAGGGYIVNLSSLAGKNPFKGGAAYNSSKFGLNGFSEAMMLDHRADNIRVSYVMPGSVDTEFSGMTKNEKTGWKIAPEDIAEIVLAILKMPARTTISRVEVRPSIPKQN